MGAGMCRWAAYLGRPIFLEDIVSRPGHSLIRQSHGAVRCQTPVNADGFGLAWYGERDEPGLYRDVMPAWSDPNLRSLTATVKSPLFMAHVRASTGTATSRNNCHPFAVGRWSFMHNGQFGGYDGWRRAAELLTRLRGTAPHVRLTCAFSDGRRLYAARYATDDHAPTLFHRWSDSRMGRAVVSEPLETDEADWLEVPPGSFCVFEGETVTITPFVVQRLREAA